MGKGVVVSIDHAEKKIKDGKEFYVITLSVADTPYNIEKVTGVARRKDYFKPGDKVKFYHHDKWDRAKVSQPERILGE